LLSVRIDRTMTGIALASAINTAAMPAMGSTLRDARSPFGGLGEGRSGIFHLRRPHDTFLLVIPGLAIQCAAATIWHPTVLTCSAVSLRIRASPNLAEAIARLRAPREAGSLHPPHAPRPFA
jgi:hypothetical protein